ncbi:hypothetical protein HJG60_008586 [Phyllostomus discolor]|uniref:Uncharacterized protein n=1 Tax=Phyllostomus discolor TaxID=89673 RepID=A0A834DI45_9CHIR|nr:hypothetical protein HJG60_008586 [Phyllostomus discolor]
MEEKNLNAILKTFLKLFIAVNSLQVYKILKGRGHVYSSHSCSPEPLQSLHFVGVWWPCFFLLLLLWKVGRQEMQGRGGELDKTLGLRPRLSRRVKCWISGSHPTSLPQAKANISKVLLTDTSIPHSLLRNLSFCGLQWNELLPPPTALCLF